MKLTLIIKSRDNLILELKDGKKTLNREPLTISPNLDKLLIRAIDKILTKNRIDRLSLKSLEIRGKMKAQAVSAMIIQTVKNGLGS